MKQKTVEVKLGNETKKYILQNPGVEWIIDNSDNTTNAIGLPDQKLVCESYLEHVVVSPKKDLTDFDPYKGKEKKVEVGEKKYTLIHPGIAMTLKQYVDIRPASAKISARAEKEWYLKNVVQGDLKLSDFDSLKNLEELIDECATLIMDECYIHLLKLAQEVDRFLAE